jgi:hypothetical protein
MGREMSLEGYFSNKTSKNFIGKGDDDLCCVSTCWWT